jgi:hypothetical protein
MGVPIEEQFEKQALDEARGRGWEFVPLEGSMALLKRLLDGDWNDDFLVVRPGSAVAASYDDGVIRLSPARERADEAEARPDRRCDQPCQS